MRQRISSVAILIVAALTTVFGQTRFIRQDKSGGEGDLGQAAQEQYEDRAYPNTDITNEQREAARAAYARLSRLPGGKKTNWQPIGPEIGVVPGSVTYTITSGRVTPLALSPNCSPADCKIFVGAAGGGVCEADNACARSAAQLGALGDGIPSNAIGSIIFDPTDRWRPIRY